MRGLRGTEVALNQHTSYVRVEIDQPEGRVAHVLVVLAQHAERVGRAPLTKVRDRAISLVDVARLC